MQVLVLTKHKLKFIHLRLEMNKEELAYSSITKYNQVLSMIDGQTAQLKLEEIRFAVLV